MDTADSPPPSPICISLGALLSSWFDSPGLEVSPLAMIVGLERKTAEGVESWGEEPGLWGWTRRLPVAAPAGGTYEALTTSRNLTAAESRL